MKPLSWFTDRIGQTIYRDATEGDNIFARKLGYKPVTIADKDHAQYLFDIQNDFQADDGIDLNYREQK